MRFLKLAGIAAAAIAGTIGVAQTVDRLAPPTTPPPAAAAADVSTTAGPAGTPTLSKTDVEAWLDGFVPFALHSGDLAGAVVMIVKDGQVLTAKGYGYADTAKRKRVDPQSTLFRPGSVSKLVTWTAVMQLVEAGRIDLDADVNTYLDFKIPPRGGKPVTMRQILTHTAGFEEAIKDLISQDDKPAIPLGTYLKRHTPKRIFDAGTTPAYSNWGTSLAGYVVERVSGLTFDDYVEQRIFAPLDMRTASFRQPLPPRLKPLMAVGYPRASEKAEPFEVVHSAPAGSLSASGADMAKFMLAHLQQGRGILKPETAKLMHDSPLDKVDPMSLMPPLNRMELGFFETNVNGRNVIAHLGDTSNFHSSLHLFMDDGVGLYFSTNSAGKEGASNTTRLQLFHEFADRYFPDARRNGQVDAKTAKEHARMMTGLWQASRRASSNPIDILNLAGQTAITVDEDGALVIPSLKGAGGGTQKWDEIAPFVWQARTSDDRIAAKVVDGKVVRWSFDLVAPFTVFDRVPTSRSSGWLLPALYASLAVLLLTFLYWPGSWYVRRRHKAPLAVSGPALKAYRATRIMALLVLALLAGWATYITAAFSNLTMLSAASDGLLWFLQIAGAVIFFGAVGIAGWNAWLTWRDGRKWTRKLWSLLILIATLVVLYIALAFHLVAMTVAY